MESLGLFPKYYKRKRKAIKMLQKACKKSTDKAHDKLMTQQLQTGQLAQAELAALKRSRRGAYSEINTHTGTHKDTVIILID